MYYIAELLRILEGLHKCSIIHGDIKPDNCLIRDISPEEQHIIKVQKVMCSFFGGVFNSSVGHSIN